MGAECPSKAEGVKCFKCAERGHVASRCPKKNEAVGDGTTKNKVAKSGCARSQTANQICIKEVKLGDTKLCALLDTGRDISLLSKSKYDELCLPPLNQSSITFRGLGTKNNKTLGFINTTLEVDNHVYAVCVHLIPDDLALHDLLLGTDFIRQVELNIKSGDVHINPIA